jgi:cyclohexyl-isocyanide hydratase
MPTCTFDNCPPLDLICLPGGAGVVEALADAETVDFIRRQGGRAEYVTSVCMGAFLLGAAGLLNGRRAATHWAYVDLLPLVGARHEKGRVVRDGNVFTSGGVTSGIDFAFSIVAELAGPEVAQAIQLGIEYDPSPPFDSGHPDKASEAATALMIHRNEKAHKGIQHPAPAHCSVTRSKASTSSSGPNWPYTSAKDNRSASARLKPPSYSRMAARSS